MNWILILVRLDLNIQIISRRCDIRKGKAITLIEVECLLVKLNTNQIENKNFNS